MVMKKRKYVNWWTAALLAAICMVGCSTLKHELLDPKAPVVLVLWHSYNANVKAALDEKIIEFNETVGKEKGIIVDAYGYGSRTELDEALYSSVNHMIGSEAIPNLFSVYPDSACRLDVWAPLVELDTYFSEEELGKYHPEFLEEGIWGEEAAPKMIPAAKSTELFYLNEADWKRFSSETGATDEMLATWEGLSEAAQMYYDWSGGKPFLGFNMFGDFSVVSAAQLGVDIYIEEKGKVRFNYPEETAKKVWDAYYVPHINGWYKSETYNQDGVKSGKLLAYIGSSAGAIYFPEEVIIDKEHMYPVECRVMAYPSFEGGTDYMTQRGANIGIFKSDETHEYASAEFLKWFTDPPQNMEFTISAGYLPVEKEALASVPELLGVVKDSVGAEIVKKSVMATLEAMDSGTFYSRKTFLSSYNADSVFNEALSGKTAMDLEAIEVRTNNGEDKAAVIQEYLQEDNFQKWYAALLTNMSGELDEKENKK